MSTFTPSKKYLFKKLKKFLNDNKNKNIGIDLASESFKNSVYFKTKKYLGVDINLNEIKLGLENFKSKKNYGIHWDFTKKNTLGKNFADVVVSTNSLSHINSFKKKISAVKNFIEIAAYNGEIFIQTELFDRSTKKILEIVNQNCNQVNISYYHNIFSQLYLSIWRNNISKSKFVEFLNTIKFNYLVSLTENLTSNLKFLNTKIIIIATVNKLKRRKKINIKFKKITRLI